MNMWIVMYLEGACLQEELYQVPRTGKDENHSTFLQEPRLHYIKTILHCDVM